MYKIVMVTNIRYWMKDKYSIRKLNEKSNIIQKTTRYKKGILLHIIPFKWFNDLENYLN